MRRLALLCIRLYQRFLSPYKGFCCAYRHHTGRGSCSALGYRAIRRFGVWRGWGVLRERLYRCGVAHRRFHPKNARHFSYQRGECDLGCACDLAPGEVIDVVCTSADCVDCGCDLFDWGRERRQKKREVL